jgi:hypothetical protein
LNLPKDYTIKVSMLFPLAEFRKSITYETPWSTVDAVATSGDVGAKVFAAKALGVEERHCLVRVR